MVFFMINSIAYFAEDAVAAVLEEVVQTSYRRGGNNICPYAVISKEAVKDIIHNLKFPAGYKKTENKRIVETLYIDADEDKKKKASIFYRIGW